MIGRLYGLLLYAYPKPFRDRFGTEMRQAFSDRWSAVLATRQFSPKAAFLLVAARDWIVSSINERMASMLDAAERKPLWRSARGLGAAALTVAAGLLVSTTFLQAFYVPTGSMEGSLLAGDHVLVGRLGPDDPVEQGDLISFRYPQDRSQMFMKRVIGVPGDRIRIIDKQVIRNGRRLIEPYAQHKTSSIVAYRDNFPVAPTTYLEPGAIDMLAQHVAGGEVIVPAGSLFVLGDNRDVSLDSRYWGFLPRGDVTGRPLLVYWSFAAEPEALVGSLPERFFTRTRWNRTLHMLGSTPPKEVEP